MYYVMRASAPSLHRESTDSLICYASLYIIYGLMHKILETNDFAQALCGEFIRTTKVRNHSRCSSLFSLSKSHVRKLAVNCGFRARVFEAP